MSEPLDRYAYSEDEIWDGFVEARAALHKAEEALADERDIKERALGFGVYVEEKLEKLEEVARELLAALNRITIIHEETCGCDPSVYCQLGDYLRTGTLIQRATALLGEKGVTHE